MLLGVRYYRCKGNLESKEPCKASGKIDGNRFIRIVKRGARVDHNHPDHQHQIAYQKTLNIMKENAAEGVETLSNIVLDGMEG